MAILNWSFLIIIISVHARLNEVLSEDSEPSARNDEYKGLTHSYSVPLLAHWIQLSSNATFHLSYDFNFLVLLA